jgi:hypothetical protein
MQLNEFINGENLKKICDTVIDQNTLNQKRNYTNNDLIFCKTDYIGTLFNEIKNDNNQYNIITHQSDYEIDERIFNHKPKNIKNWFAQNVNYKHPNLIPLPIGLENHEGPSKGGSIDLNTLQKYDINEKYIKNNFLYSNFNVSNHADRIKWCNHIKILNFETVNNNKSFNDYINDLKNSYFCASPRGHGIDCHRTWESLYCNCIPIVPKHFIYDSFNAPIIQIEKETDLTLDLLKDLKNQYEDKINNFDKNILTIKYWAEKINKINSYE